MTREYSRVTVTGGAGFIGSHLVDRLLDEGFSVTVIDNLFTGRVDNIAHHKGRKEFRFVRGDIRDFDLVKKIVKDADAVFHEAALTSVVLSVEKPTLTADVNIMGTLIILKASLEADVKRFIFASSGAIYGSTSSPKMKEVMVPKPTSPYGVSKSAAENYVRLFHELYGLETVSLRYFNVYGPRQSFDAQSAYGGVIPIFVDRLFRDMPPIIYGDGEQTRDFVYFQDVVEANMLALNSESAAGEVLNIGTGTSVSVNQIAEILKNVIKKDHIKNVYGNPRLGDIRHGFADIDRARRILGYCPKFSVKEGLTRLVNWCNENKSIGE